VALLYRAPRTGDGVVLYTDGITEAAEIHHRLYGIARLCTVISQHWAKTAHKIQAAVIADVRCHIGAQKVCDDITFVVAKQRLLLLRHEATAAGARLAQRHPPRPAFFEPLTIGLLAESSSNHSVIIVFLLPYGCYSIPTVSVTL